MAELSDEPGPAVKDGWRGWREGPSEKDGWDRKSGGERRAPEEPPRYLPLPVISTSFSKVQKDGRRRWRRGRSCGVSVSLICGSSGAAFQERLIVTALICPL